MSRQTFKLVLIALMLVCISACSVNPVTGENQLLLIPESQDLSIGQQQYLPSQQSQGGEYVLDPALSAYVTRVGKKLAAVSDKPNYPYEFVVLNNSVPNAWALPSGKIAINRGLLIQLENEAQLAAVLGHEIVHAAARHGAQRMQSGIVTQVGLAGLGLTLPDNDYRNLIIGGAALGAQLTTAKYGRDHELESDKFGMKYMAKAGYDLQGAVELQALFLKMKGDQKSGWLDGLFASHPPSQERYEANKRTAAELQPPNAFRGEAEFQKALRYIKSKQPAYDKAQKASAALKSGNTEQALSLINEALKIEPLEATFYAFRGELYEKKNLNDRALKDFDEAVKLNPKLFSSYLKRGQHHEKNGRHELAKADLEKSLNLLPTSVGSLYLADSYAALGNKKAAQNLYGQAASSSDSYGQEALSKFERLDIADKPEKYLKVNHFQDPKGPLLLYIDNTSTLNIDTVTLESYLYNANNQLERKKRWVLRETIKAKDKSRYYPVPVVYHLAPQQKIKTVISGITLE